MLGNCNCNPESHTQEVQLLDGMNHYAKFMNYS
jgi:hypothetical protein